MAFQTEYDFELPRGYLDDNGTLHKRGVMRLATAADEILPMRDPRVQQNAGYLAVILLSRVIVRLGDVKHVDTKTIEKLYTADLAYLQNLYRQVNEIEAPRLHVACPKCDHDFEVEVDFLSLTEGHS